MKNHVTGFYLMIIISGLLASNLSLLLPISSLLKILSLVIFIIVIWLLLKREKLSIYRIPYWKKITQLSLTFFTTIFVIATGGLFSPLFILVYIVTISLAFITSLPNAFLFLIAATVGISVHSGAIYGIQELLTNPVVIIEFFSLLAIVPFSYVISRNYHLKGKKVNNLLKELSSRRKEQSVILDNIDDGVVSLDSNLFVTQVNSVMEKIIGYRRNEIVGKVFFEIFCFKDVNNEKVLEEQFPIDRLLSNRSGFRETTYTLSTKNGEDLPVIFKMTSIVNKKGSVEGFFLFIHKKEDAKNMNSSNLILEEAIIGYRNDIEKFGQKLNLLYNEQHLEGLSELTRSSRENQRSYDNLILLYRLQVGELPGIISKLDIGNLVREVFNEINDFSSKYNVKMIGGSPYTPELPISTNKIILKKIIEKILELSTVIASETNKKIVETSIGTSEEKVFIFIKCAVAEDFPQDNIEDIFVPFFGRLVQNQGLSEANELEGYIAKELLKENQIKGDIHAKISESNNEKTLIITISLPKNI